MYRSCIFCSAPLGSNESIERFPVGRSVAFDGAKGRLWAVCQKCARWNLAPIEERWEAIEDAERLFRDTRMRVQSENIGLAKLPDGTRLIRVGQALPGELAAWRYGESLVQRRRRYLRTAAPMGMLGAAAWLVFVPGYGVVPLAGMAAIAGYEAVRWIWKVTRDTYPIVRLTPGEAPVPAPMTLLPEHVHGATMVETEDGGIGVHLPGLLHRHEWSAGEGARVIPVPVVVSGDPARRLLSRAMVIANERGAPRNAVLSAVDRLGEAGEPGEYLRSAARERRPLLPPSPWDHTDPLRSFTAPPTPIQDVALEMALHEETERRALEGELAMLQAMWREAEEIAGIADRLPEVPAPEPPRISPTS